MVRWGHSPSGMSPEWHVPLHAVLRGCRVPEHPTPPTPRTHSRSCRSGTTSWPSAQLACPWRWNSPAPLWAEDEAGWRPEAAAPSQRSQCPHHVGGEVVPLPLPGLYPGGFLLPCPRCPHGHPRGADAQPHPAPKVAAALTFEDDLQLIPKDVKDTVAGVGLGDHVALQPASARVLVEVVTGFPGWVHVLEDPGRCSWRRAERGRGSWLRAADALLDV